MPERQSSLRPLSETGVVIVPRMTVAPAEAAAAGLGPPTNCAASTSVTAGIAHTSFI